jgi:parvulin-like peptidyl-prolyl isomerase
MSLKNLALPIVLIVFLGLGFSQTATKAAKTAPKPTTAQTASPKPKPKAEPKQEEREIIPPADPNALFPPVVAKVNGKSILGRDLERLIRMELANIGNPEWKSLQDQYQAQLIYSFIQSQVNSELIYQKASAMGFQPTDVEVKEAIQQIAKTFKSDAEMNDALAKEFMSRAAFEKNLYKRMVVNKYVYETIDKKIVVAPEELEKYYSTHPEDFHHEDLVKTSHILIRPAGNTDEQDMQAKKRAEDLLARVKKGEDFAKLAKANSMDASASQGGDIGFAEKDALDPEYSAAAFSLPPGSVELVRTAFGYHIIKVTDKKKEGSTPLEEAKPKLTVFLKKQKSEAEVKKVTEKLREQAKIEFLIPVGTPLEP